MDYKKLFSWLKGICKDHPYSTVVLCYTVALFLGIYLSSCSRVSHVSLSGTEVQYERVDSIHVKPVWR